MTQLMLKPFVLVASIILVLTCLSIQKASSAETSLSNGTQLNLFGIGIHQEKRNDIYVGALFSPEQITDVADLNDTYMSKRMSFKFVAKYTPRQLSRLWKQRIAMNNSKSVWRPMTKEIIQFSRIFKRPMQDGDLINIDYIPGIGTEVFLNNTSFLTVEKPEFYQLLLNIWVGTIPPTEAFKEGITGKIPDSLQASYLDRFNSVETIAGRFDEDKAAPATKVAQTPAVTKPAVVNKPVTTQKQPEPKPQQQAVVKNDPPVQTIPPQSNNDVARPLDQPKTEIESEKVARKDLVDLGTLPEVKPQLVTDSDPVTDSNNENTEQAKTSEPEKKAEVEKVAKLDAPEPEEDFFDADLAAGSYTLDLISSIRKYQTYPKKALAAGDEGDITVMITIDNEGSIVSNKILKRSGSRILDRAVLRMIRKAQPFPKIPAELNMTEFEFEVPLTFRLSN